MKGVYFVSTLTCWQGDAHVARHGKKTLRSCWQASSLADSDARTTVMSLDAVTAQPADRDLHDKSLSRGKRPPDALRRSAKIDNVSVVTATFMPHGGVPLATPVAAVALMSFGR